MSQTAVVYDPAEQRTRRRRSRVSQQEIADQLNVSDSAISDYELGNKGLPFALTGEDYESALLAIVQRKRGAA